MTYATAQLKKKKFESSFKVTSKSDTTKPTLTGLTYTPRSVNALGAYEPFVHVTLKAADTGSGVDRAHVTFTSPSGYVLSLHLAQVGLRGSSSTWDGEIPIPRCSEPGTWTVSVELFDAFGNVSKYSAAQLKAKDYSSTLCVQALDWAAPSATLPATVAHTGAVVVTFSEPTLWQGSSNPFTVSDSGTLATVVGTWTCKTASGTVVGCNADGISVKTASFKPTADFTAGHKYTVSNSGGIYDRAGNGPTYVDAEFKAT